MRIRLFFKFLFDKKIPIKEKWWGIIPLLYILSPIDLIPYPIFGFSIIDDIIVFLFFIAIMKDKLNKYYGSYKDDKIKKDNVSNNIIDGVDYEVHDIEN